MGYLYVPELVDSNSDSGSPLDPDTRLFVTSNGMPTPRPPWWTGWKARPWIRLLSGIYLKPSEADHGVHRWISSLLGFRANLSRALGLKPGKTTIAGSGRMSRECFARWSRLSWSWKTSQGSLFEDLVTYSATWPNSGSMRSGTCFLHRPAELHISGEGYFSSDVESQAPPPATHSWPTPTAGDSKSSGGRTESKGCHDGVSLTDAVRMYPTPTARDGHNRGTGAATKGKMIGQDKVKRSAQLPEVIKEQDGGQLNPRWVEWLMGYPLGWTDCTASETLLYQEWLQTHF